MSDCTRCLATDARLENLPAVLDFLEAFLQEAGVPQEIAFNVHLATDEICTNIIRHAYAGSPGPLTLTCHREGDMIRVETRDHGRRFEPERVAEPDITAPLEDRPIGGLGIFLVRRMMDEVGYERDDAGVNHWRMGKRLPA